MPCYDSDQKPYWFEYIALTIQNANYQRHCERHCGRHCERSEAIYNLIRDSFMLTMGLLRFARNDACNDFYSSPFEWRRL